MGHFGLDPRRFVLMRYHQGQSTLPRVAALLLQSVDVSISKRETQRLLTGKQDDFLAAARDVLCAGLPTSPRISVDRFAKRADVPESVCRTETGVQYHAKNGFCTQIGNDRFTWFGTRFSRSRLNFLDLLRGDHTDFGVNDAAVGYRRSRGLPAPLITQLTEAADIYFVDLPAIWTGLASPRAYPLRFARHHTLLRVGYASHTKSRTGSMVSETENASHREKLTLPSVRA